MSYIRLRGRWCDIIVLNAPAQIRLKVMIQREASTRNYSSILSVPKEPRAYFAKGFQCKNDERRYFQDEIGEQGFLYKCKVSQLGHIEESVDRTEIFTAHLGLS